MILEGRAQDATKPAAEVACRLAEAIGAKYGDTRWQYRPAPDQWDAGGLWLLRPAVAFGWGDFPRDVTRWRFGPA